MRFLRFWWDFVVGDDWIAALGVAVGIGAAALIVWAGVDAWWLIPVAVALVLFESLRRETKSELRREAP